MGDILKGEYDYYNSFFNFSQELEDETFLYGWKSESPLTPFAPSYVYYFMNKKIFSEEECKEWNTYLLEQEPILLDKFRMSRGDGLTGLGDNSPLLNSLALAIIHQRFESL